MTKTESERRCFALALPGGPTPLFGLGPAVRFAQSRLRNLGGAGGSTIEENV